MKFKEWHDKIQKLSSELSDLTESLYADGHSIIITVGPESQAWIDDSKVDIRHLRPYFTHHKEDFEAMLEALSDRCKSSAETLALAQNIAVYDAIPRAVIDRLKGEDTGDDKALIQHLVEDKFQELFVIASKIEGIFEEVTYLFPSVGDHRMYLERNARYSQFRWGGSAIAVGGCSVTSDFREQMLFLGNFDVIKSRLEEFVAVVEQLRIRT